MIPQRLPKTHITLPKGGVGLDGIQRRAGDRVVMPPDIMEEFLRGIRKAEHERSSKDA